MNRNEISRADRRILEILQDDSQVPVKTMAIEFGWSVASVYKRIRHLEEKGYITCYKAELDRSKLGFGILAYCHINLKERSRQSMVSFEKEVSAHKEVLEVIALSGQSDYMLKIVSRNIETYKRFLLEILSNIEPVERFHSHIVLDEIKSVKAYPVEYLRMTSPQ